MSVLRHRRAIAALATATAFAVGGASPAGAVHWPLFGGDGGRSGYQPVDERSGALDLLYSRTAASDQNIVTSITTSAGMPAGQRVIYGTADGRIHLRTLLDGAEVGPAGGIDVSDEVDAFGDGAIGSVTPAETSTAAGLGQVFAVHNDAAGVSIAQIDEATGTLVSDAAVAAANNYSVNSSTLITGPSAADGSRALFFVAQNPAGDEALFRVRITSPGTTAATIEAATKTADINAAPESSPTLVFLTTAGSPTAGVAHVAVGTLDGKVLTFLASDLSPARQVVVAGPGDVVQTPIAPVSDSGNPPGAANSGASSAPFVYVAAARPGTDGTAAQATTLYRLTPTADGFTVASSPLLNGAPSSAVATDQEVVGGAAEAGGRVFVATESNLYAIDATTLDVVAKASPTDSLQGGLNGYSATVPAASGDLVFISTDSGAQQTLRGSDLQPVPGSEFTQAPANNGSALSIGQPSISRGFVQFGSDRGLFVYRFASAATPPGGPGGPGGSGQSGYWMSARDGGVFAFGAARFFGSLGSTRINSPIVGMAVTPSKNGYWLVGGDGGIFAYGDAGFFGSTGGIPLNQPIVGMASTPSGRGYWLVASDGGIFAFGDASFFGSTGAIRLNQPVVGMASTPTGRGYWLVAADGGIFAYGDAKFFGSTGSLRLNQPVVGMASTPSGNGYWLVASDGGIFAFGDAGFAGSTGGIRLNQPIVGMDRTATGRGYVLAASDGGAFVFGDGVFTGSAGGLRLVSPVSSIVTVK